MHSDSDMKEIVEVAVTSMHTLPYLLIGQVFLHSSLHFFGLHLSGFTISILNFSDASTILY